MAKSAVVCGNIGHPVVTEDNTGNVIAVRGKIDLARDPDIIEVSHENPVWATFIKMSYER